MLVAKFSLFEGAAHGERRGAAFIDHFFIIFSEPESIDYITAQLTLLS